MASAFSHVAIPFAMRIAAGGKVIQWRILLFAMFASVAPDLDAIAFRFGVPYESQWGHRGFTHSIFFAAVFSIIPALFNRLLKAKRSVVFVTSFLSMASHGVLDACTTGGLGVAFLWPMDSQRFFLPWQVIEVSPISISRFFTQKGVSVISSEFFYIWLPCLVTGFTFLWLRKFRKKISSSQKQGNDRNTSAALD